MKLHYKIKNSINIYNTPSPLLIGTAGKVFNDIDYSNDAEELKYNEIIMLSNYLKINQDRIRMLKQIHSDIITDADNIKNPLLPEADGMITASENTCLVIRTADCVPVFVYDNKQIVLGAVHSGWKGCRLNIAGNLIKTMKIEYGSDVNDLYVYILPSIGPKSYKVNMDVSQYFKSDITSKGDNIYLDLWKNISRSLINENIPEKNIFLSEICTYKNNSDFFSHRKGDKGRNLNFAYIKI